MKRLLLLLGLVLLSVAGHSETIRKVTLNGEQVVATYYDGSNQVAKEWYSKSGDSIVQREGSVPDGLVRQYLPNGTIIGEWNYKNGKKDGMVKRFYDNGRLRYQVIYSNGRKHGKYDEYHSNGKLLLEESYSNGNKEGISKIYLKNGTLFQEITYAANKRQGTAKTYYGSGRIGEEAVYSNDKREGITKIYFDDDRHTVAVINTYKEGKLFSQKKYSLDGKLAL
jgi:antitoxin component YwqK of YwqJK toxin-antitoxin module